MSRIHDLIAKHCPGGVPFKALGEIGEFTRGRRFTKDDVVEDGLSSIHYGEIYTRYGTWTLSAVSHVREELRSQLRFARTSDIVVAVVAPRSALPMSHVDDTGLVRACPGPRSSRRSPAPAPR